MNRSDHTTGNMRHLLPALALALLFALLPPGMTEALGAPAAENAAKKTPARPRIGLVLAGGGAKGAAHVGVLKVLEELRIPIDVVAGTSMGSIVGGLYASGLSPQDIEREIQGIDWVDVFVDAPEREDRSFRRKTDDALYLFKFKPGFNDGEIQVPLAYIHGQKFDLQLNRLTRHVAGIEDFDRLPIPFRAVATDLETGQEVVLKSGSLSRSLRASMAVPGAFDPVELDGKLLVDGGLANNVPVSVARAMGADVVIVSDLGSDLLTRDQITSGLSVAGQLVNFLFALNSQAQLKSLGPRDVLIPVKLGKIGAGDFNRITQAIPLGEQAARGASPALKRLSLDQPQYQQHLAARPKPRKEDPRVDFVRIENQSRISDEVIASHISIKPGERLDIPRLEKDIQQVYGLELFESVRYEVVEDGGQTGLVVQAREKSWGPGYLQFGLISSSNFEDDVAFRLGMAYTLTQINPLNGELRLAAQIGDEPGIMAEIFQPLDPEARFFVAGKIGAGTRHVNRYDGDGNRISETDITAYQLELGAGRQFGTWGEVRLGYRREGGTAEVSTGPPAPDQDLDTGQLFARLMADQLDSLYFPTKGLFGRIEYRASRTGFGADTDFDQWSADYMHAFSWGKHSLVGSLSYETTLDDNAPVQSLYRLGGFLRLSGYRLDELSGQHSGLARLIYLRRNDEGLFFKGYLGASLELGNVWQKSGDVRLDNTITAASLFVGADTIIGPLYLGYGRNDAQKRSIYLYLGPLFSFR